MGRIILASQSPRRRELLEQMGLADFTILPAEGEETIDAHLPPAELVRRLALAKAREVAARVEDTALVIAADTIVVREAQVMGKPRSEDEARAMLRGLSGRTHQVYTGMALIRGAQSATDTVCTDVTFRPLTEGEICGYVAAGESMDKAGAYGIQGRGALLVEGIRGDYFNVVGLPVCRLGQILRDFGVLTLGE